MTCQLWTGDKSPPLNLTAMPTVISIAATELGESQDRVCWGNRIRKDKTLSFF